MAVTIIGGAVSASSLLTTNAQTGTTYTLALTDGNNTMVELSNASAITLTVPLNSSVAFPVGSQVNLLQTGAGQVTVAGASGVTELEELDATLSPFALTAFNVNV